MKRILVLTMVCFSAMIATAWAHPPRNVDVTYDPASQIVKAQIIHQVSNPTTHYVFKVEVSVNGKLVKEEKFTRQTDNLEQLFSAKIPEIKPGDEVSVTAYCNISGRRGATIKAQ